MSTANKWFSIRASARDVRAAEILIFGDIGESWWGESITAASFVRELAQLDVDDITVRINSHGGSVSDGIAIYNALRRHKARVTTSIEGVAAAGSYAYSGGAATFRRSYVLDAESASYTLTGAPATLNYSGASSLLWTPQTVSAASWSAQSPGATVWTPQ